MKTKLLIIALLSTLYACHTTKTVESKNDIKTETLASTRKDEKQILNTASNSQTGTKAVSDRIIKQMDQMQSVCNSKLVIYDTSKPIDLKTGKPPILSESTTCYSKNNEKNRSITTNTKVEEIKESNFEGQLFKEQKQKKVETKKLIDKSKVTETSTYDSITFYLGWLVMFVLIALAIWLYIHFNKRLFI